MEVEIEGEEERGVGRTKQNNTTPSLSFSSILMVAGFWGEEAHEEQEKEG
jgi:hypothetical protein